MFRFITGATNKGQSLFKSRDLIALKFMEKKYMKFALSESGTKIELEKI